MQGMPATATSACGATLACEQESNQYEAASTQISTWSGDSIDAEGIAGGSLRRRRGGVRGPGSRSRGCAARGAAADVPAGGGRGLARRSGGG